MATATAVATRVKNIEADTDHRHNVYFGTIAVSPAADTYLTGGLTLSFAGISGIPQSSVPVEVRVWSEAAANGYQFQYIRGTTNANGKLVIRASVTVVNGTGPATVEMTNTTAIPAAISGDTALRFKASWVSGR